MSRTNAGYTITDSVFIGNVEFVIGHNPSYSTPYVTWECKNGDNYYWGHYIKEVLQWQANMRLLRRYTVKA